MKTLTIQLSDEDFARLEAGAKVRDGRAFDSTESLASLAVDVGLYALEAIEFDIMAPLRERLAA